jgi:hypothetical protein
MADRWPRRCAIALVLEPPSTLPRGVRDRVASQPGLRHRRVAPIDLAAYQRRPCRRDRHHLQTVSRTRFEQEHTHIGLLRQS